MRLGERDIPTRIDDNWHLEALTTLRHTLDPHEVGEAVTIRLPHDTGMRLVNTLIVGVPPDGMRAELVRIVAERQEGREAYEMHLCGVRFEWPGRRVDLSNGNARYI